MRTCLLPGEAQGIWPTSDCFLRWMYIHTKYICYGLAACTGDGQPLKGDLVLCAKVEGQMDIKITPSKLFVLLADKRFILAFYTMELQLSLHSKDMTIAGWSETLRGLHESMKDFLSLPLAKRAVDRLEDCTVMPAYRISISRAKKLLSKQVALIPEVALKIAAGSGGGGAAIQAASTSQATSTPKDKV